MNENIHKIKWIFSFIKCYKIQLPKTDSKSQRRKKLSFIKNLVNENLLKAGFTDNKLTAKNENAFFRFEIPYNSKFGTYANLRPYLKIEFIQMPILLDPKIQSINSLVNETLGLTDGTFEIPCQALEEITVEKILATLRRLGDDREFYSDNPYLMRHLYDVSHMVDYGLDENIDLVELFKVKN